MDTEMTLNVFFVTAAIFHINTFLQHMCTVCFFQDHLPFCSFHLWHDDICGNNCLPRFKVYGCTYMFFAIFSSPERPSGTAIALPPAAASAFPKCYSFNDKVFLCYGQDADRRAILSSDRSCFKGKSLCDFLFTSLDGEFLPKWVNFWRNEFAPRGANSFIKQLILFFRGIKKMKVAKFLTLNVNSFTLNTSELLCLLLCLI